MVKVKKIKKVLIIYRVDRESAERMANELSLWLKERKIVTYSHPDQKITGARKLPKSLSLSQFDLTVVLGGDGTYLEAVRLLRGKRVPILGVNLGSLGFLTETRAEDLYSALQTVLDHKMEMRPRSMLDVQIKRANKLRFSSTALNDVVIERGDLKHLINIGIYCERHLVSHLKADGIIVASPTGSTAYNLAAHGPILHPEVAAMVVTPICPHALTSRPLIFPDSQRLSFRLNDEKQKAFLVVDGKEQVELRHSDEVIIKKDKCDHFVLRNPSHNYFDLLREKLKFGVRD